MVKYYRVRKSWEYAKSQLGAYTILANAKVMADKNPGYEVYDWNGKRVYPEVTGVGVFTILEVREGKGSDAGWGRLKSGAGCIALDMVKRV